MQTKKVGINRATRGRQRRLLALHRASALSNFDSRAFLNSFGFPTLITHSRYSRVLADINKARFVSYSTWHEQHRLRHRHRARSHNATAASRLCQSPHSPTALESPCSVTEHQAAQHDSSVQLTKLSRSFVLSPTTTRFVLCFPKSTGGKLREIL